MAAAAVLPPVRPPPPMDVDFKEDDDQELDKVFAQVDEKSLDQIDSAEPMAILAYYRHLLPWKHLFLWLNRSSSPAIATRNFTHREFAFTLQNEAYLRYQSFSSAEELKREVCRLNPARFEIGPVYTAKPKDRKTVQKTMFKPVSRELVFDIDMTDYDEIRTCCSGKGICKRCWAFIAVAVEVLDATLRQDFGFKHLLWVYSGRRGIHCWISDDEACSLSDEARKSLTGWLDVVKGSANQVKKVDAGPINAHGRTLHPSLRRAIGGEGEASGPLKRAFVSTILEDQDCFKQKSHSDTLLELLPASEADAIGRLRAKWEKEPFRSSTNKWTDIMEQASRAGDKKRNAIWKPCLEDVILQYTYPRIDLEVSKHLNHLLKSPFVIHPGTGRVCVPLDPANIWAFDPTDGCPTVARLLKELQTVDADAGVTGKRGDKVLANVKGNWERTSLRPFVEIMDRHCQAIMKEQKVIKQEMDSKSVEAW